MTGRELIIYISENHLEDTKIDEDAFLIGFMAVEEAAVKFKVGRETIFMWCNMAVIDYIRIGLNVYIPKNQERPTL